MIVDHGRNHKFIGSRRLGQGEQAILHGARAANRQAGALTRHPLAIDGRVGISGSRLRRFQRQVFALGAPHIV